MFSFEISENFVALRKIQFRMMLKIINTTLGT